MHDGSAPLDGPTPLGVASPVAAIDLGTHTALLLVCRSRAGGRGETLEALEALEVLHDELAFARLGEGLAKTGHLSPAAVERTLGILAGFLERAAALGVAGADLRAAGTAVLRRAADTPEFLARCRSELGLEVEVLSGAEEARLGHRAVASDRADTLIIDAGGASTEIAWDRGTERVSIPVGALLLTERYLGRAGEPPVRPGGWTALRAQAEEESRAFPAGIGAEADIVLLGGTATNLACLELASDGLAVFDHERAEGLVVTAGAAERWADELAGMELAALRALPIEPERAEVLPAGLACLAAALARIGAREARVTRRGLRYGIALEMLAQRR